MTDASGETALAVQGVPPGCCALLLWMVSRVMESTEVVLWLRELEEDVSCLLFWSHNQGVQLLVVVCLRATCIYIGLFKKCFTKQMFVNFVQQLGLDEVPLRDQFRNFWSRTAFDGVTSIQIYVSEGRNIEFSSKTICMWCVHASCGC